MPSTFSGGSMPNLDRADDLELDLKRYELRRGGKTLRLEKIPMELLILLVERREQLVGRQEIVERLWGKEVFLDADQGINTAIRKIRMVLRDDPEQPRYLQTVVGKGYRFVGPITFIGNGNKGIDLQGSPTLPAPLSAKTSFRQSYGRVSFLAIAAITIVVAGSFAYVLKRHEPRKAGAATSEVRLVVLPFDNLSGDPEQAYLSDSMTEEMIAELGQVNPRQLAVIARATSMEYRNSHKTAEQIGRELHVDYLLEGSVRRSNDRVRITTELIQARDQTQIWAHTFDRDLRDVLTLQTDVAGAIAEQVRVKFDSTRSLHLSTTKRLNPEAYENYLKGLHYLRLWHNDKQNIEKSQQYLERAISLDPGYALAYARLAQDSFLSVFYGQRPQEVMPKGEALARKALSLDPELAEAHDILANIELRYNYDFPAAEREAKLAIELNPNYPEAHDTYADYLSAVGRHQEALAEERHASELDPLLGPLTWGVGFHLLLLNRYDEALTQFQKLLEPEANDPTAHYWMGNVYELKHMYKEAVEEWAAAYTVGGDKELATAIRRAFHVAGYQGVMQVKAQNLAEQIQRRSKKGKFVDPLDRATVALQGGNKEEAFKWLDKAYEERSPQIPMLMVPGSWKELRGDPRFLKLVGRVGIPYREN
jgi:TolB-like protein/DNA-binding winged helix-turn-helix (wHTH) protein/Tfp pilus assembly protein PilF